jgi:transposase
VWLQWEQRTLQGRVCAIKKSRQAAEKARKAVLRQAQKGGSKPKPETLEAAGYTFVFTTIPSNDLVSTNVLEMYRGRWQIELVFKRLKSILGLGHLRKTDKQAAQAWIHGKLFVAFLVELLIRHAETFFPWGYPLCETLGSQPLLVAGGSVHASRGAERSPSHS